MFHSFFLLCISRIGSIVLAKKHGRRGSNIFNTKLLLNLSFASLFPPCSFDVLLETRVLGTDMQCDFPDVFCYSFLNCFAAAAIFFAIFLSLETGVVIVLITDVVCFPYSTLQWGPRCWVLSTVLQWGLLDFPTVFSPSPAVLWSEPTPNWIGGKRKERISQRRNHLAPLLHRYYRLDEKYQEIISLKRNHLASCIVTQILQIGWKNTKNSSKSNFLPKFQEVNSLTWFPWKGIIWHHCYTDVIWVWDIWMSTE